MTMAVPQALLESEGWQRDVAQRNRTVQTLSRRLNKIMALHKGADVGKAKICTECFDRWPCISYRLARGDGEL